jgi:hypothetical protein
MKRSTRLWLVFGVALFATLGMDRQSEAIEAQGAVSYAIDWYSIDGGGALTSSAGNVALAGTIGQADAGAHSGGVYELRSGFWAAFDAQYFGHLPLIGR